MSKTKDLSLALERVRKQADELGEPERSAALAHLDAAAHWIEAHAARQAREAELAAQAEREAATQAEHEAAVAAEAERATAATEPVLAQPDESRGLPGPSGAEAQHA